MPRRQTVSALSGFVILYQSFSLYPLFMIGFNVSVRLGDLLERIAPINEMFLKRSLLPIRQKIYYDLVNFPGNTPLPCRGIGFS